MTPPAVPSPAAGPRPLRSLGALGGSVALHALFALLLYFDVAGIGGGFGLGVGPGFGIGSGGGVGLGEKKRRQIYSLEDIPEPVRPREAAPDETIEELLAPKRAATVVIPQSAKPVATVAAKAPVVHFQRPTRPSAGTDLSSRIAASGAGTGGFGLGGGGGGGIGLASLGQAFGNYVGTLRKVGLDVAIVVDSTGSMQNVIDDLKRRLGELVATMQRLVPTARIGAVAFRDRDDGNVATAPRQSEDFVVRWSDLTFTPKKVQTFLAGIVAEGGGDYEEAVKDGLEAAMEKLKWRSDAKKVIIIVGSSPPHQRDVPAIRKLVDEWHGRGGVVSAIDVSKRLHEEHERKIHRWLYGEELQEISPLPDFYQQVRESYGQITRSGGGELVTLGQDQALVRHLLALAFGSQWQREVGRVAKNF